MSPITLAVFPVNLRPNFTYSSDTHRSLPLFPAPLDAMFTEMPNQGRDIILAVRFARHPTLLAEVQPTPGQGIALVTFVQGTYARMFRARWGGHVECTVLNEDREGVVALGQGREVGVWRVSVGVGGEGKGREFVVR